jgi:hypothetical protein
VLAPAGFEFCDNVRESARIRAGEPLLRRRNAVIAVEQRIG